MLNKRSFSDVLPDPPKLSRRKEDARQVEFVRIGQALKLETIVKGDAPTSLATTSLLKRIVSITPLSQTIGNLLGTAKKISIIIQLTDIIYNDL
jgi:hypothetical protein